MISNINNLIDLFEKMNNEGFNTTNYLKWGFFFLDKDKTKLFKILDEIIEDGYNLEAVEKTDEELWQIHVTKIDVLTPEKLHLKNIAFNDLAAGYNVQLYDGWDVERLE